MALALGAQSTEAEPPLGSLVHKPGDQVTTPQHASRWDYPKTFTVPEGCQVHFVAKGDTLWDLGSRYLGNPFAWPQIWEKNPWVKDAHWIFPGDPLLIPVKATTVAKAGETPDGPSEEVASVRPERGHRASNVGEMAYSFQDFLQLPYLVPEGWGKHVASLGGLEVLESQEGERTQLGDGERIYLKGGEDVGAKPGDRKVILKRVRTRLVHPDDRQATKSLGDVVQQVGVARLEQVRARTSVAVIERALDAVERGDMLVPFQEPATIPFSLRKDVTAEYRASEPAIKVIYTQDRHGLNGNSSLLVLDQGSRAGLKVGDILVAMREREWSFGQRGKQREMDRVQMPVGQVMVVRVGETSATVRVLRCSYEIEKGMRLSR